TVVAQLPPKSPVDPLELSSDGRYVRIAPDQWIERRETRIARKSSPPPQVAKGEVWVDIDLDEQVIVVYRDLTPVYATMISTGIRKRRTPTGTFRITKKVAVQSMYSTPSSTDQYKVADVPWIMSFSKVYALHGAYWHDRFGGRRSHGCINLSPRDARAIYQLVSPAVPAGWMEARATSQEPGSVVRIRSSRR
ncbi:MAG: L,D-transpeptidase, partial [Deltaproteobacteria bacterium]|nr:L,D-transpeptidase [Deltaproteobacteria bacterium]